MNNRYKLGFGPFWKLTIYYYPFIVTKTLYQDFLMGSLKTILTTFIQNVN